MNDPLCRFLCGAVLLWEAVIQPPPVGSTAEFQHQDGKYRVAGLDYRFFPGLPGLEIDVMLAKIIDEPVTSPS